MVRPGSLPIEAILEEGHPGLNDDTPQERIRRLAWIRHYARNGEHDQARALGWNGEWDAWSDGSQSPGRPTDASAADEVQVPATDGVHEGVLVNSTPSNKIIEPHKPIPEDAPIHPQQPSPEGVPTPTAISPTTPSKLVEPTRQPRIVERRPPSPSAGFVPVNGLPPSMPMLGAVGTTPRRRVIESPRRSPTPRMPVMESPRRESPRRPEPVLAHLYGPTPDSANATMGFPEVSPLPSMKRDSIREMPIDAANSPQPLTDAKSPGRRALWI